MAASVYLQNEKQALRSVHKMRISCTQLLSNSLIRKLSHWFQHDSTKESLDTSFGHCVNFTRGEGLECNMTGRYPFFMNLHLGVGGGGK